MKTKNDLLPEQLTALAVAHQYIKDTLHATGEVLSLSSTVEFVRGRLGEQTDELCKTIETTTRTDALIKNSVRMLGWEVQGKILPTT